MQNNLLESTNNKIFAKHTQMNVKFAEYLFVSRVLIAVENIYECIGVIKYDVKMYNYTLIRPILIH